MTTADEFNAAHPVGTPVLAFPGIREGRALHTRTRTPAWVLGSTPVVSVEDYAGGIALTHIEIIEEDTMPTDVFTTAAAAEGQARIAAMLEVSGASADIRAWFPAGFEKGAEWARDHLARQEATDAEQAARFAVESKHHLHGTQCLCGFESHRARSRTEHIMGAYFEELTAAKEARA